MNDTEKDHWTLQQFTTVAGKPWYALQRHGDSEVAQQFTGYKHEMEAAVNNLGITPEVLPSTTEEAFLKRGRVDREVTPEDDSEEGRFLSRISMPPTGRGR